MMNARTIGSADAGQLSERLPKPIRGHFQNLGFIRLASRAGQRRCAIEHRHVADEIARPGGRQDLLLSVARLEDFEFAAQDHHHVRDRAGPP